MFIKKSHNKIIVSRRNILFGKKLIILSLLFFVSSFLPSITLAETYYLDANNGNDKYDGLASEWNGTHGPWKTIDKAKSSVSAGDIVELMEGNYGEVTFESGDSTGIDWDNPIVYKAHSNQNPPILTGIDFTSSATEWYTVFDGLKIVVPVDEIGVVFRGVSYLRFLNLLIEGEITWEHQTNPGSIPGPAFHFKEGTNSNILVDNCEIRYVMNGFKLWYYIGPNVIFSNNNLHHISGSAFKLDYMPPYDYFLTIEGNNIHDWCQANGAHASGIAITASKIIMRNNIIHSWARSSSIMTYEAIPGGYKDLIFENNLIYDPRNYSDSVAISGYSGDIIFRNNTIIGVHEDPNGEMPTGTGWYYYRTPLKFQYPDGGSVKLYNNVIVGVVAFDDGASWDAASGNIVYSWYNNGAFESELPGNIIYNPGDSSEPNDFRVDSVFFVGPFIYTLQHGHNLDNSFKLASGSDAIGFAAPAHATTTDLLGNLRDASPDAGCYEFTGLITYYTITTNASGGGSITPAGEVTAVEGGNKTFTVEADTGYHIDDVLVDGVSQGAISSYTFTNIAANHIISADFGVSPTHTITASADTGGTISPSGEVIVTEGDNQTFTISPDSGYKINNVLVDAASQGAISSYTFTNAILDHTIEATFDISNPNDALVGYWKFDDGSGTTTQDSSGNSNTATLVDGPIWTSGKINGAISYDGTDDYVDCGTNSSLNLTGSLTIIAWINPKSFGQNGWGRIVDKGDTSAGYSFFVDEDVQSIAYVTYGGEVANSNSNVISLDTWQHVAAVYNESSSSVTFYVDGQEAGSSSYSTSPLDSSNDPLVIGIRGYDLNRAFDGIIDDVRVYNRALSAIEVLQLYNEGTSSNQAPIANAGPDQSVTDSDNNGSEQIALDGSGSTDSDGTIESYVWSENGSQIATGEKPNVTLSTGQYTINLTVTDDDGTTNTDTVNITINEAANQDPIANAGPDQSVTDSDSDGVEQTTLDGSGSTDSDGTIQSYVWSESGSQIATGVNLNVTLSTSQHTITLTVTDDDGATDTDTVIIIINEPPNQDPIANAGQDQSVTDSDNNGSEQITLDGSGSTDSDGTIESYVWSENGSQIATGVNPNVTLSTGQHTITLTVTDDDGATDTDTVLATINEFFDITAPSVTNYSPATDEIQVPLNNLIILHFVDVGEGVDANSVSIQVNNNIVYSGNTAHYSSNYGDCRRTGTKADYTFVYQADETFNFNQKVTVKVNGRDLAGNVMNEHSHAFRTEMRSFSKNKNVDSNSNDKRKGKPATKRDSDGDIWVVWDAGNSPHDIYVSKLTDGTDNFGVSVQLTNNAADQRNATIAIDSDNKLYVAWQDNRWGNWDIFIRTSIDGTNWTPERRITDSNDNEINPTIVVDDSLSNKAYIVWQDDRGGNQDIYIASSINNFVTKTISQVTSDSNDQTEPAIAVGSDNTIYVVWVDARGVSNDIHGAASNNSWINVPIVSDANNQSSPAIATESTGNILHLLWVNDTSGDNDVYYASSNGLPGSPLSGNNIIDDDSGADQLEPAITVTGSTGNNLKVFACWQDNRNTDTDLYFVEVNTDSGTNVFVGDDSTSTDQSEPAMDVDGVGYPYLVWTDRRNTNTDIYYAGSTYTESNVLASENVSASASSTTIVGTEPNLISGVDDISIEVPAGAYSCDITITVLRVENPPKVTLESFSLPYDFGPSGIEFSEPVTITIPYEVPASGMSTSAYWYNPLTAALSQEGITDVENIIISPTLHALRFKTTHFTQFLIGGSSGGGGIFGGGGGGGSGGGGGGCSISHNNQGSLTEFLLPYIGLTVAMVIIKRRDMRNRKARNTT